MEEKGEQTEGSGIMCSTSGRSETMLADDIHWTFQMKSFISPSLGYTDTQATNRKLLSSAS